MTEGKQRLDQALVERGLVASRARAQAVIKAGHVRIAGRRGSKPAEMVSPQEEISLTEEDMPYVSRGALKLAHALEQFKLSPAGLVCLDVGASTGGFTQILLEQGARLVYAVDVGHGQLADKLARDPRIISLEKLNIREVSHAQIPDEIECVVCDVSFISLAKALPAALALCGAEAFLVALIKPQFEVGRENIGKGGIVRDESAQQFVCEAMREWINTQANWSVLGLIESPVLGGDGNREFLLAARKRLS